MQILWQKWDKNHRFKSEVWGKLNDIFFAQEGSDEAVNSNSEKEQDNDMTEQSLQLVNDS